MPLGLGVDTGATLAGAESGWARAGGTAGDSCGWPGIAPAAWARANRVNAAANPIVVRGKRRKPIPRMLSGPLNVPIRTPIGQGAGPHAGSNAAKCDVIKAMCAFEPIVGQATA